MKYCEYTAPIGKTLINLTNFTYGNTIISTEEIDIAIINTDLAKEICNKYKENCNKQNEFINEEEYINFIAEYTQKVISELESNNKIDRDNVIKIEKDTNEK